MTNQENLFLSFLCVQNSPNFSGDFSCRKSTHQMQVEVKTRAEHSILPSTACHNYKAHTQQQLQVLLSQKFALKHFWDPKMGKVLWTNKPHDRETFTRIPIWDSCCDTIPVGSLRGLSKKGSGPSNLFITPESDSCPSALGVFWNDKLTKDIKMQQHPALKIFTKTNIHLENFSGFLATPLHVQRKLS